MRSRLTTIIIIGMLLGIAVGYACHTLWPDPVTAKDISDYISLMTDVFLRHVMSATRALLGLAFAAALALPAAAQDADVGVLSGTLAHDL